MRIGNRLGDYVLVDKLGEGGFGEVWRAEDRERPGEFVAVKVSTRPDAAASLGREGRMQHSLQHPNIVRTLSSRLEHDPPYLVNEWVQGESLRDRLGRVRRMWPGEALPILRQVLHALSAAHGAGLVHRDVKPANVLLGHEGTVKLADFGLGRAGAAAAGSMALSRGASLSAERGAVGTFFYMSPEQLDGLPGDLRSDLYSCGVMLYEMLTGVAHPIRLPVAGVAPGLMDVIDRALSTDPDRRFRTAGEMLAALEGAEREPAPEVHCPRPRNSAPRKGLIAWTVFAVAAMVLFYVVVGVLTYCDARKGESAERCATSWSPQRDGGH